MSLPAEPLADFPSWPVPALTDGEFTIAWGEDGNCAGCGYFLTAGSPALLDEDGRPLCGTCAEGERAADITATSPSDLTEPERQMLAEDRWREADR
jgi:hypothetical protein